MRKFFVTTSFSFLVFALFFVLTFSSCTKKSDSTSSDNTDIPKDPGTAPPPTKLGPMKPACAVSTTPGNPNRIKVNVGGLLIPGTTTPITYTTSNLTVIENGVVKGIKITPLGSTSLGTDIVFVIDVTGSMSGTINGVKESITSFLKNLKDRKLDVRCGAIAYSDNNDVRIPQSINGIASNTDPGAFTVVGYHNLTATIDSAGPIYNFIDSLRAGWKGYYGGDLPEGGFDGLWYAFQNFSWRSGAQRMFIVLTDISSWGLYAPAGSGTSRSPWRTDSLAQVLSGRATVHVVSPDTNYMRSYNQGYTTGAYDMHWLATPGSFIQKSTTYNSGGTGGIWTNIYGTSGSGKVDLTTLPITAAAASSALVEFVTSKADGTEKTIRVVVDIGTSNGEVIIKAVY